jgi:BASS family bile acid:Na+ symporter
MQASFSLTVGLPVVLGIIMLGLGLSLKFADFSTILAKPKPVLIGLLCHSLVLPLLCLGLVLLLDLPPAIAVGMMLLAASPAGTSGALFTHLANGDVALSIIMAAVTTVLAVVTLPLVSNASLLLFYGKGEAVTLDLQQILQFFAIAIVPALAGVLIRSRYPSLAARLQRPVKLLATVFLVAVIAFALIKHWSLVGVWGPSVGFAALLFSILTFGVGYYLPRLLGVDNRQAIALAMAAGVHNAALVITMAMSEFMLNNSEMAIPPAMYGLVAYITGGIFVLALNASRGSASRRALAK